MEYSEEKRPSTFVLVNQSQIKNIKKRTEMKNVLSTAALVALYFATNAVIANGPDRKTGSISVSEPEVYREFITVAKDPVFKRKGDKVLLNMLNLDGNAVVIRVTDADKRVVFEEKITGDSVIQKAFNFADAFKGDYTIEILDNKQKFQEKVSIR